jgi:hypothetical protein
MTVGWAIFAVGMTFAVIFVGVLIWSLRILKRETNQITPWDYEHVPKRKAREE